MSQNRYVLILEMDVIENFFPLSHKPFIETALV